MRDVYIIGVGMTRFAKHLERSIKSLTKEAIENVLADAKIPKEDIEAAWFSNVAWGDFTGQHSIRGQVALRPLGVIGIPIINVENACAGGSTALHEAWIGIAAGLYECALAIGAEKLTHEDKMKSFGAFMGAVDVEATRERMATLEKSGAGKDRSVFMDFYSISARGHIERYGTTQKQLAAIASKNHFHSSMNPKAQYQKDMSIEEVLAAREVSWPLTVPMCAPIGDGAAAAIVCSEEYLKKLDSPRPVKIRASLLTSGSEPAEGETHIPVSTRVSKQAFDLAGVGPEDIDLAEVHDATAFGELHQTEVLGFCDIGDGGPYAESGATRLGGKLPINTSGGLESNGHPIGASGLSQVHELVTQLRHEAGDRQVENCRLALSENGGGSLGIEEAALGLHILERVGK